METDDPLRIPFNARLLADSSNISTSPPLHFSSCPLFLPFPLIQLPHFAPAAPCIEWTFVNGRRGRVIAQTTIARRWRDVLERLDVRATQAPSLFWV